MNFKSEVRFRLFLSNGGTVFFDFKRLKEQGTPENPDGRVPKV